MPMKYVFTLSIIFHSTVCSVSENIMSASTQLAGSWRPSTRTRTQSEPTTPSNWAMSKSSFG